MITVFIIALLLYSATLATLAAGNHRVNQQKPEEHSPEQRFSILIPFRNERENLPELIKTLNQLEYPKNFFEVIFINDESEDDSEALIKHCEPNFIYQILQNRRVSGSPKKDALLTGIHASKNPWIITTDADCVVPTRWLVAINNHISTYNPDLLCGGVRYQEGRSFIAQMQGIENAGLQFITRGAIGLLHPVMANGANLIYRKSIFFELNGFSGNDHIPGGDDVLLMEKFRNRDPRGIRFLNSEAGSVLTKPVSSLKELINQRVRWASKTKYQKNQFAWVMGIIMTVLNILVLTSIVGSILSADLRLFFLLFYMTKIILDFAVIFKKLYFNESTKFIISFIYFNLSYPVVFVLILLKILSGRYRWKSRSFLFKI